jgi:NAD(P)-dependent dehydrogenase (short-subunit alcohol dehydrogenase family)
MPRLGQLAGKTALIVGAASGIGQAAADVFAREGAELVLADIDAQRGATVARELGAAFVPVDVRDSASVQAMIAAARQALPALHCLVN